MKGSRTCPCILRCYANILGDSRSCFEEGLVGEAVFCKEEIVMSPNKTKKPCEVIKVITETLLKKKHLWRDELQVEIPKSWVKYGDLILFGHKHFKDPAWNKAGGDLWEEICKALKVKRIGRMHRVKPDGFRSPRVEIIFGGTEWVHVVEGHIRYTWDVQFCMFCPGNATEKFRVAQMDCRNETVVDMYAGIGYFTLPFLVHAKADFVHACEWNPHAVSALRKNLQINKVSSRCCIHVGDNREVCPQNVADRVYMGLIPTCQPGIETSCKALKFEAGGVLHLHENVFSQKSQSMSSEIGTDPEKLVCEKCQEILGQFPCDLFSQTQDTFDKHEDAKCNHFPSFTLKGKGGVPDICPSVKVMWKRREWLLHAIHLSHIVSCTLSSFHNSPWFVTVINLHRVKSYAPHIDHVVFDLKCSPFC